MKWKHIIGDVEVNRDLVLLLLIGGLYARNFFIEYVCKYLFMETNTKLCESWLV